MKVRKLYEVGDLVTFRFGIVLVLSSPKLSSASDHCVAGMINYDSETFFGQRQVRAYIEKNDLVIR